MLTLQWKRLDIEIQLVERKLIFAMRLLQLDMLDSELVFQYKGTVSTNMDLLVVEEGS